MKSALQFTILAAFLMLPGSRAPFRGHSRADAVPVGVRRSLPVRAPLALRKSDDPRGQEPANGILDDASPGWEEETDDFEGFAIPSRAFDFSPAGSRLILAPVGRPRSTFSPLTRSSLLRC